MRELDSKELLNIEGGATSWYSASFINAASRALSTLLNIGRSLGTSIRRAINGTVCPI